MVNKFIHLRHKNSTFSSRVGTGKAKSKGQSKDGRWLLSINRNKPPSPIDRGSRRLIISVDLGGTNLRVSLVNSQYKIKYKETFSTRRFRKKEDLIAAIIDSVNKILAIQKLNKTHILGLGLGLPGPIDIRQGIVHFFPNNSRISGNCLYSTPFSRLK